MMPSRTLISPTPPPLSRYAQANKNKIFLLAGSAGLYANVLHAFANHTSATTIAAAAAVVVVAVVVAVLMVTVVIVFVSST